LRALTIKQPWAHLIIHGGKDIENRSWNTKLRGRFFVHAALVDDHDAMSSFLDFYPQFKDQDLIRGAIIGSVEIVDVMTECSSFWFRGPKGFVLKDPKPCAPIYCKGQMNFWETGLDLGAIL
jgi:ASCH domain